MDSLIQQLRVSLCKDCGGQLDVAVGLVTKIVEQLRKDKVPSSSVKEVALEIVEAVLAELPPSGQKLSTLLRPLIPAAIDAGIPFGARCFSWLSSVFLPKAFSQKPLLTSVVTPRLLPVLAASQGVVAASVQCVATPPPLSIVHDGPLPNVPEHHVVVPEDHVVVPDDQILSVDEEQASENDDLQAPEDHSSQLEQQLEASAPEKDAPVLSTRELKFDLD